MSKPDRPIKSAYELAMERLREQQGEVAALDDEQKRRLAAVTQEFKAKIAERELALKPVIEAALVGGDPREADRLRDQLVAEIKELRAKEEAEKELIRGEGGTPGPREDRQG